MKETILIAAGGAIGSVARYWISIALAPLSRFLPWSTIGVNVLGSFLIVYFACLTLSNGRWPLSETWRLAFMVGVCGGFTTFSSFSFQNLELLKQGAAARALLNIVLSVTLCLIASYVGFLLAEKQNTQQIQTSNRNYDQSQS